MAKYNKSQLYFFKFPNTFFDSDEIEDILKDDDGPSIVILYLKLILLATNKMGYLGRIIAGELKPYTTEELFKKTDTSKENFIKWTKKLNDVGLLELKDKMLFIEDALNYTNQTVGAFKKQLQRNNEEICPPNCPPEEDNRNQNLELRNQNSEIINNKKDCSSERLEVDTHPALQDIVYRVVNYLNKKAFKNFKPETKKTIDLIKLRLSEGYTEEDFYTVIDKMTNCWLSNGDLDKYLRPITLFGDNFDSYLNEDWERQETDWQSQYY